MKHWFLLLLLRIYWPVKHYLGCQPWTCPACTAENSYLDLRGCHRCNCFCCRNCFVMAEFGPLCLNCANADDDHVILDAMGAGE